MGTPERQKVSVQIVCRLISSQTLADIEIAQDASGVFAKPDEEIAAAVKLAKDQFSFDGSDCETIFETVMDDYTRVDVVMLGHPAWPDGVTLETIYERRTT